jgi:hypothetical protein
MDMRAMHELKDMLCKEIDKIAKKGELTAGSLETVHKLTDTVKNIDKIMMLEEDEGYSERGDSRGRYSREGGMGGGYARNGGNWNAQGSYGNSYDDGNSYARRGEHYVRGHYSRDDGKDKMLHELGEMMEGADHEQRRILERAMQEIRNA